MPTARPAFRPKLIASIRISPVHFLLGHLLRFAVPIGVVIALAELAVGLGALLGLWPRVAAAGGIVLSLTLFLTVSFHSSPYYTGADIVFLFAWIPLLLADSGGVLSLDGLIAARVATENKGGPPTLVPIRFELVQQVCGNYEADTVRHGADSPATSPLPVPGRLPRQHCGARPRRRGPPDPGPRGTAVAASAVIGAVAAGAAAGLGRAVGGAPSPGGAGTSALTHGVGPGTRDHLDDGARRGHLDDGARRDDHDGRAAAAGTRIGLAEPGARRRCGDLHGPGNR